MRVVISNQNGNSYQIIVDVATVDEGEADWIFPSKCFPVVVE
jgi:hypothetical protein